MSCADVRPLFPAYLSGQIALTERVLVEAHLRQCGICRPEEARRYEIDSHRSAKRSLPALDSFVVSGWSFVKAGATEAASRTIGGLMQAVSFGTGHGARLLARAYSVRAIALELLGRAMTHWPSGPRPHAGPPAPSRPRPEAPQRESAPPVTRTPTTPVEPGGFARARAADVSGTRAPAPPPRLAPGLAAPHVVGRLSTKDRSAAEHAVTALLSDVQGTELDRTHHARFTSVEVIVPHAAYREFTHGLDRIGFWRLEATTFSLPDAVHMTIRVSE